MTLAQEKWERITYGDLRSWDDGFRWELYDGVPVALAAPLAVHQRISMALSAQLYRFLEGKPCEVFAAPLDVRLFQGAEDNPDDADTVLQPDLLVVCDPEKIDRYGVRGAPDWVIEILSDGSRRYDLHLKRGMYERAGVREYWVADPGTRSVQVFRLSGERYGAPERYDAPAALPCGVLDGCVIDLARVFPA